MIRPETSAKKPRRTKAERKLNEILREHRGLIHRTIAAIFVSRFVLVLIPLQLKFLLDPLVKRESVIFIGVELDPTIVLVLAVSIGVLVAIVRGVADYVYVSTAGKCGHSIVASLRIAMFEHILRLPTSYVDHRGTGKILLRFIGDSDALRSWISRRAPAVFVDRIVLVVLALVMLILDWRLALLTVLPVPLVWLMARWWSPTLSGLTRAARRKQAQLTGDICVRLDWIRQSKWLDRDKRNRDQVREAATEVASMNTERDRNAAVLQGTGQFFAFISVPILLFAGVLLTWNSAISLGTFVAFVWLAAHLAITVHRLNAALVIKQKAYVSIERILRLLERSAERGRSSHLASFRALGRSLRLEDVLFEDSRSQTSDTKTAGITFGLHGPGVQVLDGRFDISRLTDTVLGFSRPRQGRILIDDQSLHDVRIESVRNEIGWIGERPLIIEGTIGENIQLAAPRLDEAERIQLVHNIIGPGCKSWLAQETKISGATLTGDELIQISILRAVITKPKFVFVDDFLISDAVLQTLNKAISSIENKSLIVISARTADRLANCMNVTRRSVGQEPMTIDSLNQPSAPNGSIDVRNVVR